MAASTHLKLPKAGSASETLSCVPLTQVPATPTFSTFKSYTLLHSLSELSLPRPPPLSPSWLPAMFSCPLLCSEHPRQKPWPHLQAMPGAHLAAIHPHHTCCSSSNPRAFTQLPSPSYSSPTPTRLPSTQLPPPTQHSDICWHFSMSPGITT